MTHVHERAHRAAASGARPTAPRSSTSRRRQRPPRNSSPIRIFREVLNCIRCGAASTSARCTATRAACLWLGLQRSDWRRADASAPNRTPPRRRLANASTLCGACFEACPVKSPCTTLLVQLRRRQRRRGFAPSLERPGCGLYARVFSVADAFPAGGSRSSVGAALDRERASPAVAGSLDPGAPRLVAERTLPPPKPYGARPNHAARAAPEETGFNMNIQPYEAKTAIVTGAGPGSERPSRCSSRSTERAWWGRRAEAPAKAVGGEIEALGSRAPSRDLHVRRSRSREGVRSDYRRGKRPHRRAGQQPRASPMSEPAFDRRASLDRLYAVNVKGLYLCSREAVLP